MISCCCEIWWTTIWRAAFFWALIGVLANVRLAHAQEAAIRSEPLLPSGSVVLDGNPPGPAFSPLACETVASPPPVVTQEKFQWTKGDYSIIPYGILWGNGAYATQRTQAGSFTFFVESETQHNADEFIIDARDSRLGLDVTGPQVPLLWDAVSGGKLEIDFQGLFNITENRGGVLLRHAYVEVKDDDFRLLAGQTWDVISPLYPNMLMYSIGWNAGNVGGRRAQFRGDRFIACSDTALWTLQGSLNQNVFPDIVTGVIGKPSNWPILEGRTAFTLGERTGSESLPTTIGFSGHIGESEFDYNGPPEPRSNQLRTTWSVNADFRIPLSRRLGLQGEFFTGQDLSSFFGGIGQGIDPVRLNAIHSIGGWCELWYDWTPALHNHVGYMVDDPLNNDLHTVGERTLNQSLYVNLSYDLTKQFLVGVEASFWKTTYVAWEPGEALRLELVVKYGF